MAERVVDVVVQVECVFEYVVHRSVLRIEGVGFWGGVDRVSSQTGDKVYTPETSAEAAFEAHLNEEC